MRETRERNPLIGKPNPYMQRIQFEDLLHEELQHLRTHVTQLQEKFADMASQSFQQSEQIRRLTKELADLKAQQQVTSDARQIEGLTKELADFKTQQHAERQKLNNGQGDVEWCRTVIETYLEEKHLLGPDKRSHKELTASKLKHFAVGYHIQDSMWDSIIFIGFECLSTIDKFVIVLGLILTTLMSFSFVLVVLANYRNIPFALQQTQLEGLLHWRAVVAHDIEHYDPASRTSLAARVCAREMSTERSGLQMDLFKDVFSFTTSNVDEFPFRHMNGFYLCNMALMLWFCSIVQDIISNLRFMFAVLMQPRDGAKVHSYRDGDIKIMGLSSLQVALFFAFSMVPRLLICVVLAYAGVYFLAFTYSVDDLLLNAVAMVFVVELDELLFHALLTLKVKRLMRSVAPLRPDPENPHPITRSLKENCEAVRVRITLVSALIVLSNVYIINPFHDRLDDARTYLCSGNKDFLYVQNKVSSLVMFSPTPEFDYDEVHAMTYRKRAVLELTGMAHDKFMDKVGQLPDADKYTGSAVQVPFSHLVRHHKRPRTYASSTMVCIDHTNTTALQDAYQGEVADQYYQAAQLFFRDELHMHDFKYCDQLDFDYHCMSSGHSYARALCPRICGCDDPWVGQFFATPTRGCPENCGIRWALSANYRVPAIAGQYTELCEDIPAGILQEQAFWQHYVLGVRNYLMLIESVESAEQIKARLLTYGCAFITELRFSVDICIPNDYFRSARLFCPSTCMCVGQRSQECPPSCAFELPHMETGRGLLCPLGLEIKVKLECEKAAEEILRKDMLIEEVRDDLPQGCYLWHGHLVYSSQQDKTDPIPDDMTSLCKMAQPVLPSMMSRGNFSRGQTCANCFLNGSACAQDCFSEVY